MVFIAGDIATAPDRPDINDIPLHIRDMLKR